MKTVILAGGLGTRLAEETELRPKPMVEIGGRPILWHIMSTYATHGFHDFVIACGYRGAVIKQYFHDYSVHAADWRIDLHTGERVQLTRVAPNWRVHVMDTGLNTLTGGRLRRLRGILQDGTFMVTYGDGLSNIDISALVAFHRAHGKLATVTAVHPPARFGAMTIDGDDVSLEREPLERVAAAGELMAYRHHGFWQPMDTLREKRQLEELWDSGSAPWL